jgi:hypothetical protein
MACWLYIFLVQAFEPQGWRYMLYVLAVFVSGTGLFLILARRQRYWPFGLADVSGQSPGGSA